jgi:hypothetical protein
LPAGNDVDAVATLVIDRLAECVVKGNHRNRIMGLDGSSTAQGIHGSRMQDQEQAILDENGMFNLAEDFWHERRKLDGARAFAN